MRRPLEIVANAKRLMNLIPNQTHNIVKFCDLGQGMVRALPCYLGNLG